MPNAFRALCRVTLALLVLICGAAVLRAQDEVTVPSLPWRTLETRWFTVHYTRDAEAWTRAIASRLDSVHDAVAALVGSAPRERVTIIVEDPNNLPNGAAFPLLGAPAIVFWPTPADPMLDIGNYTSWGELLATHEFAHIAHLERRSRNPRVRRLTRLSPIAVGPLAYKSPRWITEGYATFVEGRLTGSGRPHGAWRPALLRQWALEGEFPTYGELNGNGRWRGGSMAYLVGSAYLEWLVRRGGDSSLVHLWRRMSARVDRSFDDAFTGVFGASPSALYGRFVAELTAQALADASRMDAQDAFDHWDSSAVQIVQRRDWTTGAPALSRDGALLAAALDRKDRPRRIVVWRNAPDSAAIAEQARERAHAQELDPEDVPAVRSTPPPMRELATLGARGGISFSEPRFLPDGERLLVIRYTGLGDGRARRDLYLWSWRSGAVRRVTHGAGVLHADPSPDGRRAVADRCVGGICDVVAIDLASGRLTTIARGSPSVVWSRPRWSSDGTTIVAGVHRGGAWRIALLDTTGGAPKMIGPDDGANRYAPAFLPDGHSIVVTSDAGGAPNLEVLDASGGAARPITRVTGAAFAPEPDAANGSIYFLRLHARGLDIARVFPDSVRAESARSESARSSTTGRLALTAVTIAPAQPDSFPVAPLGASRSYGLGPRHHILLPAASYAAEGKWIGAVLAGTDPVGRLAYTLQGTFGDRGTWRGGSLGAQWNGARPSLGAELFYAEDRPSRQHGGVRAPPSLDVRYRGGTIWGTLTDDRLSLANALHVGISLGAIDGPAFTHDSRALAFASWTARLVQSPGDWSVAERVSVDASTGRTAGLGWSRGTLGAALDVRYHDWRIAADGTIGRLDRRTPSFEQFALGGTPSPLTDGALFAQRLALPALPVAVAIGRTVTAYRIVLPGPVWRAFWWSGSAGDGIGPWHRVAGVETELGTDGIGILRLPAVHLLGGVAYSLDDPVAHETQFYLSVTYRP